MRIRSRARESALKIAYQIEISKVEVNDAIEDFFSVNPETETLKEFTCFLLKGVSDNVDDLDLCIQRYARNWDIKRMAIIDKNILRIAIFEILFVEDVPVKVSINEAVELAKRFGDVDSAKFVNGILDSVFRNEEPVKDQLRSPS